MQTIAVVVVTALILYTLVGGIKRSIYKQLVTFLQNGHYASFDQKVDALLVKLLFSKQSLLDLRLNAAILQNQKRKALRYLEELERIPMPKSEKDTYMMKGFNYFIGLNDAKNAKKYLTKVDCSSNEQMKQEAHRVYNIYILKNDHDLPALLEEIEGMEDSQRGVHEFLISRIYKNKNDWENAQKYEHLSKTHFAFVDQQTSQKLKKHV
ncbi:hypothetical protein [Dubosiella muris]|uniref:Uncharacterized protein n=1 Tax=Dubosiella muris TaxID=3038133 RepID=A0AC61R5N9_9FIRM|nr:hypothetical protein [Dubosiella muris]TGY65235.1 hypothetical protein E5336_09390 [Dubosiella muris]